MNKSMVDRVVSAVLYEGYILYPYRPSVKNRQRWTFGGLYPEAYCQNQTGSDAVSNQTECLLHGDEATELEVTCRFLHLIERSVGELTEALAEWPEGSEPSFRPVAALRNGDQIFQSWQEAEERGVTFGKLTLREIMDNPRRKRFEFSGRRWIEPLQNHDGKIIGVYAREQNSIEGAIEVGASKAADDLFKLTVRVINVTGMDKPMASRDEALLRSLVSAHTILHVSTGGFVSLLDPPVRWQGAAASCQNVGVWPVLVGEEGDTDTMLSSPIILYDYPQVAAESPGNLFDGTEVDEILTLRILTLTDEEKRAAAALEGQAENLLARTEALSREQLYNLHGTIRSLRPAASEPT